MRHHQGNIRSLLVIAAFGNFGTMSACSNDALPGTQSDNAESAEEAQVQQTTDRVDMSSCAEHLHDDRMESDGLREDAWQLVRWSSPHRSRDTVHVKVLGINDFHGQISTGRRVSNRPVGGAAILAAYLAAAQRGLEDRTILVHAGDHVGASPPASALLQDEPSIQFLNLLANDNCRYEKLSDPECNVVGTLGNHEFDEGRSELLRLIRGGNHGSGPFLESPWRGARFPYVSSNVVEATSGRPLFPPYVVKQVGGVRVGFIGVVLKETPRIVTASGIVGLRFLDEAESINRQAKGLTRQGVHSIVVLIHQGGTQRSYVGPTATFDAATSGGAAALPSGAITEIVAKLDASVDVVVSGHSHQFTNALIKNRAGSDVLVTQAFSSGTAFGDIDLEIERATGKVVSKMARIVTTWADEGPGLSPDPRVSQVVAQAERRVAPLVERVVGFECNRDHGGPKRCGRVGSW
ncbi:MAG: metallophosphoesterase [Polyangiaceae bacterium]